MASLVALRSEMRSIVLKGVRKIREIEFVQQVADEVLLEARQVVAATLYEQFDDEWAPSPEEIRAACNAISDAWSEEERERRLRCEYTSTRDKRAIADFKYQKAADSPLPPTGPAIRNMRYQLRHGDRIAEKRRAMRQDPAFIERNREYQRRYEERNKLLIKEREAARREEKKAYQRERYYARVEIRRQQARERYAANKEEINARGRERRAERRVATAC